MSILKLQISVVRFVDFSATFSPIYPLSANHQKEGLICLYISQGFFVKFSDSIIANIYLSGELGDIDVKRDS